MPRCPEMSFTEAAKSIALKSQQLSDLAKYD